MNLRAVCVLGLMRLTAIRCSCPQPARCLSGSIQAVALPTICFGCSAPVRSPVFAAALVNSGSYP